eukprot:SAG31_NODE_1017_length_10360_cov_35.198811_1_plen_73_part_00
MGATAGVPGPRVVSPRQTKQAKHSLAKISLQRQQLQHSIQYGYHGQMERWSTPSCAQRLNFRGQSVPIALRR